jgi:uncharacterized protein (UPF0218 family)
MSSTDTDSQCRPYATELSEGDYIRFRHHPDGDIVSGRVRRVRWKPRFAHQDRLLITVSTDDGTIQVDRDALV